MEVCRDQVKGSKIFKSLQSESSVAFAAFSVGLFVSLDLAKPVNEYPRHLPPQS